MTNRVVFFVFCLALLALVACGSGQTKPSLNVIEVEERTSMMNGSFLDPLGEALRKSGNVVSPEDALAAAKGGAFGLDAAPLEYPQELRFILGTFFFEPGAVLPSPHWDRTRVWVTPSTRLVATGGSHARQQAAVR